jgi:hypothetical protein
MQRALEAVVRELRRNERTCQSDLCSATGLPSWKVSRLMNRFELLGLVRAERELRFRRGRPRKFYELTPKGFRFFGGPGGGHRVQPKRASATRLPCEKRRGMNGGTLYCSRFVECLKPGPYCMPVHALKLRGGGRAEA